MKIVVVGTGGVGGYFGGLLAHSGQEVTFIARGAHLEAIKQRGLQIKSVHGDFVVSPAEATDRMDLAGVADLALISVKDYQLDQVISTMSPLVGKQTTILPLLNGFQAAERLGDVFGQDRVLGGLCFVVAFIAQPGVIQQESAFRQVIFGEWHGRPTGRAQAILDTLQAAGIDAELADDIRKSIWRKFLFITSYSGIGSVIRLPAAGLQACAETMDLLRQAMMEIESVARAKGVTLDEDVVETTMAFVRNLSAEATSSMQRDVAAGRMFELEAMTGAVLRAGVEVAVPTPVNSFLYAALKPQLLHVQQATAIP